MDHLRAWRTWPALLLACGLLTGCSGESAPYQPPLEGKFLWPDGTEPRELEGGTVEFEANGVVAASAGLVGDGTFMLAKPLPAGTYRVRVQPPASGLRVMDKRFESFETSSLSYTAPASTDP